ncbi:hypothetical protein Gogos_021298, partial [Gossypium gossypioides]|nr:hypothetical protein [Gossypium gossypioides]
MNELVDSTTKKLAERDENLEDMVLTMKKEIDELNGEFTIYKTALSNGMLSSRPKQQTMNVPKPKKFNGARSARDVDNLLWEMKQYFRVMGIENDVIKVNTASIYFTDVAFLWWRQSFVELGPTKDKFESSKPNGKGNGERNHEEDEEGHSDDGNNTYSTSGNGKPRDAKRGSNNPRDKGKRIKCFLCQGPHM